MSAPRLGIGSYAYRWSIGIKDRVPPRPLGALDLLDRAQALGVGLVQYADNLPLHRLDADAIATLGNEARARGIALELGMEGIDPDRLRRYLAIAETLDARLIRAALTESDAALSDAELETRLRNLTRDCAAAGVTLALENHFHVPSPRLRALVARIGHPHLGVCLDVANSIACGEWPGETVALLAPLAVNLHLKDYRVAVDPYGVGCHIVGTPLGQGVLDIDAVFAALAAAGRSVNVIVEHWLPFGADFQATIASEQAWLETTVAAAREAMARHQSMTANTGRRA